MATRGYEEKFYQHLGYLIRDLDRRIRRGQERLNLKGDAEMERENIAYAEERAEKLIMIEVRIKALQERIEACGEEGEVDEAKDLTLQVEALSQQLNHMKNVRTFRGVCLVL